MHRKIVITESMYRLILEEKMTMEKVKELSRIAVEKGVSKEVGINGPLTSENGLQSLADKYGKYDQNAVMEYDGSVGKFVPKDDASYLKLKEIYKNYARSMATHFPDDVTEESYFIETILNHKTCFIHGNSCMFLMKAGGSGYLITTHFAPASNVDGMKLLKELLKYDNIVLPVTEHMWGMLAKMGLCHTEFTTLMKFKGRDTEKMIFTSDKELLKSEIFKWLIKLKGNRSDLNDFSDEEKKQVEINTIGLYHRLHPDKGVEMLLSNMGNITSAIDGLLSIFNGL